MSQILRMQGIDVATGAAIDIDMAVTNQTTGGGGSLVIPDILNTLEYNDGVYKYYCSGVGGSIRTDLVWQITRVTIADNTVTFASNLTTDFGAFLFPASDVNVVKALTYNYGNPL